MARSELKISIVGDSKDAERAFKRAQDSARKFGQQTEKSSKTATVSLGKVGSAAKTMGGALGGAVFLSGAKSFVSAASDVDESLSKNVQLFGEHAKRVDKFSKESAKSFGTSRRAALEYTGVFGNLFRALDLSEGKSAGMSVELTKLAADLASFNNTSVEDALEAIRSGLVGESEPLRKFGVNIQDATLRQEALRQGLIKTTKDALTPQQKALAAYGLIFQQTSQAQGDFARTQDGAANQTKIFRARLEDLQASLGQKLLPAAVAAVTGLNQFVTGMQNGSGAGGQFVTVIRSIGTAIGGVVSFVGDVTRLGVEFARTKDGAVILGSVLGGLVGRFAALGLVKLVLSFGALAFNVRKAASAFIAMSLAMKANVFILAASAIGAVAGGLLGMKTSSDQARTSSDQLTDSLRRQEDAARALADHDLTLREAALAVADAEDAKNRAYNARKQARADGDPLAEARAEKEIERAKINHERAERNLARAEEDGKRKKEDLTRATREAAETAKGRVSTLKRERAGVRKMIEMADAFGLSQAQVNKLKKHDAELTKQIGDEMKKLPKEVKSRIVVSFSLSGVAGFAKDAADAFANALPTGDGKGDGLGIRSAFNGAVAHGRSKAKSAISAASRKHPPVPAVGSGSGLNAFNGIAQRFGVRVGSGFRPGSVTSSGNTSYHALGMARDFPGPPGAMMKFARFLKSRYGSRLAELIYTPMGVGIKDGRPFRYTGKVAADHFDHVHVAMRPGGGKRGEGDGLGIGSLKGLAKSVGLSDSEATIAAAVAMAESGGDPNAVNPDNADGSTDRGLWQINSVHGNLSTTNIRRNALAMAEISKGGSNWSPWVAFTSGKYKRFLGAASALKGTWKGKSSKGSSGGSSGRSGGSSGSARRTTLPGSASQRAFAMGTAKADLLAAQGATTLAEAQRIETEDARLADINRALKKDLTEVTRHRLMEEKTQLLQAKQQREEERAREEEQAAKDAAQREEERRQAAEAARQKYVQDVGSRAQSLQQLAQLTETQIDDVQANKAALDAATLAFHEAARVYGLHTAEADAAFVAQQQALHQLADSIRKTRYEGVRNQLEGGDFALIAAQMNTPDDTSDDIAALEASRQQALAGYQQAIRFGDKEQIREFSALFQSLGSQIEGLKGAIDQQNTHLADLYKQQRDAARQAERLSQTQYGVLRQGIADMVSGVIGGRNGLGFQAAGVAGQGVRY